MRDPIQPLVARHPAEAAELVCLAISDGDIEAALAQYERGALLRPWQAEPGRTGGRPLTTELAAIMAYRLPLALRVSTLLAGSGVALVLAERRLRGPDPDRRPVDLTGTGATVVRRRSDGTWRIAADA